MKRRRSLSLLAVGASCAGLIATAASGVTGANAAPAPSSPSSAAQISAVRAQLRNGTLSQDRGVADICASDKLACLAQVVTVSKGSSKPLSTNAPLGYGATELEKAYGVTGGSSGTIAVIGAGADPLLEHDLGVYRKTYGLPACTTANGCFTQLNYKGGKPYRPAKHDFAKFAEEEIAVETSLDVDMASAACPNCKIISLQVPVLDGFYGNKRHLDNAILHFATGVETARSLGANAVSISYGYPHDRYSDSGVIANMMSQQGMAIVSSSGDGGFELAHSQWPQNLPTVTSAGGTSLYPDSSSSRGYTEVAWNGAGSACSLDLPPAVGQPSSVSSLCGGARASSDISAVADPYTGVAVYDSYSPYFNEPLNFITVGGTSVASPFIGGLYARAGSNPTVLGPNTVYAAPASELNDVTIGTNFGLGFCQQYGFPDQLCDAGTGWDGPTGVGTPRGLAPFTP